LPNSAGSARSSGAPSISMVPVLAAAAPPASAPAWTCRSRIRPRCPSVSPVRDVSVTGRTARTCALRRAEQRACRPERSWRGLEAQRRGHARGLLGAKIASDAGSGRRGRPSRRSGPRPRGRRPSPCRSAGRRRSPSGRSSTAGGRPGIASSARRPPPSSGTQAMSRGCRDAPGASSTAPRRPFLDDPPGIHHRHPVAELRDDAEVMGDEQDRQPAIAPQIVEQRQDLRLHRDVERRGRLVGDDHLGVVGQRHGDADALAHAARHLVRVGCRAGLGIGDAHGASRRWRARRLGRDTPGGGPDRLDQLVAHAVSGCSVESGSWKI
jgi:hypothetical protein